MLFIILQCLLVILYFADDLGLAKNRLRGTIPTEIGILTQLSESNMVWFLVVFLLCTLANAFHNFIL